MVSVSILLKLSIIVIAIFVSSFDDIRLRSFDITGDASSGDISDLVEDHFILEYTVAESFPKRFR